MNQNQSSFQVKAMVYAGLYGLLMFLTKMMLAGMPNVEPVSLLVLLAACCMPHWGLASVLVYVLLEWLVWPAGLWSICYLYIWPAFFLICRLLSRVMNAPLAGMVCALFGLGFGALFLPAEILVLGFQGALSWWLAGIPFDLIHGASNLIIGLLLYPPLSKLLKRILPAGL